MMINDSSSSSRLQVERIHHGLDDAHLLGKPGEGKGKPMIWEACFGITVGIGITLPLPLPLPFFSLNSS